MPEQRDANYYIQQVRRERREQRRQEAERFAQEQAERDFQYTWRYPKPDEFEIIAGMRSFQADCFVGRKINLDFRWKVCLNQKCIARSPANRVGLWANGRLCAHYYGWIREDSDLFGPGFGVWMERTFQRRLVRMEPAAVWCARNIRPAGSREDGEWKGVASVSEINYGGPYEPNEPCLIQTRWINGSVYAQIRNVYTLQQAVKFAWESLGVSIQEREVTPARHASGAGVEID